MRTTLKNRLAADETVGRNQAAGSADAFYRRDPRDPGLRLQWLAGLLAALAIAGGCVAQQNLSRSAAVERRTVVVEQQPAPTPQPAAQRVFQDRLQTGYLDLAMAAYERRAFAIADFFAKRSIDAGGATPPDPIAPDFDAPAEAAAARRDLVAWLVAGGVGEAPESAATAQLAVDCWLREARPDGAFDIRAGCRRQAREALVELGVGPSEEDIARTAAVEREGLAPERASAALAALVERWRPALERSRQAAGALAKPVAASLRRRAEAAVRGREAAPVASERDLPTATIAASRAGAAIQAIEDGAATRAAFGFKNPTPLDDGAGASPAAEPAPPPNPAGEITLSAFPFDSARLGAEERRMIGRWLEDGAAQNASGLLIEGHTDSAGPAGYNLALSERRAEAVRGALLEALGRKAPPIAVRGMGETQLAVATGDGVREPRNRRVVIRIQ